MKVRLNTTLFPTELITITPFRAEAVHDVNLGYGWADDALKVHSGDGEHFDAIQTTDFIDLFVHDGQSSNFELSPLRLARLLQLRKGHPLVLTMDWAEGRGKRGRLCIVWTYEDRVSGRAPRIAFGNDADVLLSYTRESGAPVTGKLLGLSRRVRQLTKRDIDERIQRERSGAVARMTTDQPTRVASIAVQGFRGFREEAILKLAQPTGEPGSGLTIVVGANNTGKSTIWESFDAISKKSAVSFSVGQRNSGTDAGVRIRLSRMDGSIYTIASQNVNTSETRVSWQPEAVVAEPVEIVSVPSRRQFEASFNRSSTSQRDWMAAGQDFSRNRQSGQMSPFTGRLFDLHNDAEKKAAFDELMSEVIGGPFSWTIDLGDGQHGQSYFLKVTTGDGVDHTSEGLGDGIISLLFILNALYDSEPKTLLVLDEPELSLHPQLIRKLGRVFARYAQDRQIVLFTHSPLLVSWDHIAAGAEIARVYKVGADSKIAQVTRATIDDVSKARGSWQNPHTLGQDANEALFLDEGVIVVEGQEDAALLPVAASLVGVDLPGSIFGWGAGGEGNVRKIVALVKDLGFMKVAAVLDNNVPGTASAIRDTHPDVLVVEIPAADIRDKSVKAKEVQGLLDKHGTKVKAELKQLAKQTLQSVADYLRADEPLTEPN